MDLMRTSSERRQHDVIAIVDHWAISTRRERPFTDEAQYVIWREREAKGGFRLRIDPIIRRDRDGYSIDIDPQVSHQINDGLDHIPESLHGVGTTVGYPLEYRTLNVQDRKE